MDFATNFEGFRLGINFGRSIQHDLSLEAQEVPSEVPRARGVSPNIGYDRSGRGGGGGGAHAQVVLKKAESSPPEGMIPVFLGAF